ncbi:hypothetical protein RI367_006496 [Sorochytrium milnesiophthora]
MEGLTYMFEQVSGMTSLLATSAVTATTIMVCIKVLVTLAADGSVDPAWVALPVWLTLVLGVHVFRSEPSDDQVFAGTIGMLSALQLHQLLDIVPWYQLLIPMYLAILVLCFWVLGKLEEATFWAGIVALAPILVTAGMVVYRLDHPSQFSLGICFIAVWILLGCCLLTMATLVTVRVMDAVGAEINDWQYKWHHKPSAPTLASRDRNTVPPPYTVSGPFLPCV